VAAGLIKQDIMPGAHPKSAQFDKGKL